MAHRADSRSGLAFRSAALPLPQHVTRLFNPAWHGKFNQQRLLYRLLGGSCEPAGPSPSGGALLRPSEAAHPPSGCDALWALLAAHRDDRAPNSIDSVLGRAFVPAPRAGFVRPVVVASQRWRSAADPRSRRLPFWLALVLPGANVGFFNPAEFHDVNERREGQRRGAGRRGRRAGLG